ncbi:MAG TPA: very short patch repair endonuclease [Solibacterales bacterium]|nr:very short patch repair endonuclease [Bryobacterales bacterium]
MDTVTPDVRSSVMAKVKSKGNRSTEWRLRSALIRAGISGWTLRSDLPGTPDFVFASARLVVFVDGCFWHGCPKCKRTPSSNTEYWGAKIAGNRKRDRAIALLLEGQGWKVVRLWEHQLIKMRAIIKRISNALDPCR